MDAPIGAGDTKLRVAVVGAGAVGLGLGSCCVESGEQVHFVTRRASYAEALARNGIVRTGIFGKATASGDRFEVSSSIASLRGREFDWILVATKTPAAPEVSHQLAEAWDEIGGEKRLLLAFNGWGTAQHFSSELPANRIYSARVITGFRRGEPGQVDITVHASSVLAGSLFGAPVEALVPLCESVARGGLPCETTPDIERELWAKMLYNCALNPLGALIGVPYGVLGERRETRSIMEGVVTEIFELLDATGYQTNWSNAASYLDHLFGELLPPTAAHESSMLQDLQAGRRTEIDALSGAVVELARKHGVHTPVNHALATLIQAREAHSAALL
ncbi:MAG: 2-dehydropantoate 2-reductase [Myxococcota bacterium]|nr:2-dehydropantoate 2-reductase [Myxococcota bacterium]